MENKQKVWGLGFLTVFLWASAFPLTKIVQEHFTSNPLGFLRCGIAAILLLVIGKGKHIHKPKKEDIPWFFLSGGLGFTLYMITFNTGIQTLTSATSSIIIAITPILTAIVAAKLYNERIRPLGWVSILTAFIGVLILMLWEGAFSINIGLIWTIMASLVFCGYNILSRRLSQKGYSSLEIVTYSMLCGTILLGFWSFESFRQLARANVKHILALIYLGVFPSATAYFFWGKAMTFAKRTSEVTNFMFITPLLSTLMGFIILKEIPNMGTFIGGAVIVISIVVFNLKGK
ncbi:aromatic amino acid exporter [Anaerotignum neopropionicum]|uniref:Aromatic amino acid exporter n=1 Tax=Anaerotignum neopropionicum TaxID=36847 RepID=A0A136WB86_9FIRM|nr:DMT family transporter [Anaerotignum neopropionicum]KXL51782.1 aromatic amino acid exporter [Anaerotignum neopropionicum]